MSQETVVETYLRTPDPRITLRLSAIEAATSGFFTVPAHIEKRDVNWGKRVRAGIQSGKIQSGNSVKGMTYVRIPNAYTSVPKDVPSTEMGIKANDKPTEIKIQPQQHWLVANKDLNGPSSPDGSYGFWSNWYLDAHIKSQTNRMQYPGFPKLTILTRRVAGRISIDPKLKSLKKTFEPGRGYWTQVNNCETRMTMGAMIVNSIPSVPKANTKKASSPFSFSPEFTKELPALDAKVRTGCQLKL